MLLQTIFVLLAMYKPVHVMQTDELSCGAADRLMKETVKVEVSGDQKLRINGMSWQAYNTDEDWIRGGEIKDVFRAYFQVRPDQYMKLNLDYTVSEAHLTVEGIDYKRRPCKDKIYLKRIR
jgi:hypothetical protein